MSRKRCKRRVWEKSSPVARLDGIEDRVSDKERAQLATAELSSLEELAKGRGQWIHLADIQAMTLLSMTMGFDGYGIEAKEACERAMGHLEDDARRYRERGTVGTTGPGLAAYREVFAIHDLQRQCVSRSLYASHLDAAMRLHELLTLNGKGIGHEPQTA
jgi:hypothetical protein